MQETDSEYQKAKQAVEAAQAEVDKKKEELKTAEEAYNAAKTDAEKKEKDYEAIKKESDSVTAERMNLEKAVEEATKKAEDCAKALAAAKEKKNELISRKTETEKALTDARNNLKTAQQNAEAAKAKLNEANNAVEEATKALQEADAKFAVKKGRGMLGFVEWVLKEKDSILTEDQKYDLNRAKTLIENALNEDVSSWAPDLKNDNGEPMTGLEPTKGKTAGLNYENDAISYNNFKESLAFFDETEKYIKESTDPYRKAYVRYLIENNPSLLTNDGVAHTSFTAIVGAQINSNRDGFYLGHNPIWDSEGGHKVVLHSSDNAFISINDPQRSWIYGEKIHFDNAAKELGITDLDNLSYEDLKKIESKAATLGVIGHYTFFLYSNSGTVMGFGRTQKDSSENFEYFKTNSEGQYNSSGKAKYTFAEIKAMFAEYENSFSKKPLEDELKKAQDAQQVAKSNSDEADTAVANAQETVNNAQIAYNNATKALSEQESIVNEKEEESKKAETAKKTATNNLAKFNADNADILTRLKNAEDLAKNAKEQAENQKKIVNDKKNEMQQAEQKLADATTELDAVSEEITKAKKAVEEAQKAFDNASAELTQAGQEKAEASTKSQKAAEEKSKAEQEYKNQIANVKTKTDEKNKAEENMQKAQNQLYEDNKKFAALVNASKAYEEKVAEEKKAKEKLDNATKNAEEKAEALQKAEEDEITAKDDLKKAEAANEQAKKAFKEAEEAVVKSEKEYQDAVKKLDLAKLYAKMLLKLIKGDNANLVIGTDGDYVISCNGNLKYFTGITIDGSFVPASEYTSKPGSTIVTIPKSYWNKLKAGNHSFKFNYKYGESPVGTFTLSAKADNQKQKNPDKIKETSPNTGDPNSFVLLPTGLVLLGSLLAARKLRKKEEI